MIERILGYTLIQLDTDHKSLKSVRTWEEGLDYRNNEEKLCACGRR